MFYRKYYSELGKLLYAIANADGVISEKEKQEVKNLVRSELVPVEKHTDKFGTDAAFYTEIEFDIMDENFQDVEAAFDSFISFAEAHHTAIDQNMRDSALRITTQLVGLYRKKHKKEKALLRQLEKTLKALPEKAVQSNLL
jgi:uncharacterized tellurite resistance protein B-like protein